MESSQDFPEILKLINYTIRVVLSNESIAKYHFYKFFFDNNYRDKVFI